MNTKQIDITEDIASGEVDRIISILNRFRESGYDRLYWDGYDSSIYVYKSDQPERSKREDVLETTDRTVAMASMQRAMPEFNILADGSKTMRCSELYGNIERPAETIWPA